MYVSAELVSQLFGEQRRIWSTTNAGDIVESSVGGATRSKVGWTIGEVDSMGVRGSHPIPQI